MKYGQSQEVEDPMLARRSGEDLGQEGFGREKGIVGDEGGKGNGGAQKGLGGIKLVF